MGKQQQELQPPKVQSRRCFTNICRDKETQLSAKEIFESFLRARQYEGDFISKASDVLWTNETLKADEDKLREVREKLEKYEKVQAESDDEGGFLKLTDARIWSLGGNSPPKNVTCSPREKVASGEDRRMRSLLEYEALKRELSLVTVAVGSACTTYCVLVLSLEAAVSYGIGSLLSLLYLQLLYNHADKVSKDNIAEVFLRRKRKKIGIRSEDVQEFFERTAQGMTLSLSSPRLVFPGVLFALWSFSKHVAVEFTIPYHLQLAPMFLGFFAYKAAALIQAYRDNKDLLMNFDKEEDSDFA
ncbi:hypothetical protein O6H91_02G099600 [Diphasiastrum complanatum]|uniref:Uncharacterized protein n=1 Tax=Diphasiastrum complanatum TaxID=34168 RepID=A0ACC2EIP8_DIPCM|nr:hypothetical protein O6H91_02G099600 [Diphasiastrum complanatum]